MRWFILAALIFTTFVGVKPLDASIVVGNLVVNAKQAVVFAGRTEVELSDIMTASESSLKGRAKAVSDIAEFADTSPNAISITGFDTLSITATGLWTNTGTLENNGMGPSGSTGAFKTTKEAYRVFGISGISAPLKTLVGVFLSNDLPDPDSLPSILSTSASEHDMTSPLLNQAFAIGDALSEITVPEHATRLFLGAHDSQQFKNNSGTVTAAVTGTKAATLNAVPEPSAILIWLVLGLVGYKSMRFRSLFSANS